MTHDEKLKSQPEDTTDHEQLDKLNRLLADKLSQLRDAGVDVDRGPADLSNPDDCDSIRSLVAGLPKNVPPVVKPMQYFFDQDSSCHWYLVESAHRAEWQAWRDLDEDLEEAWTPPAFAKQIDGYPAAYDFEKPTTPKEDHHDAG